MRDLFRRHYAKLVALLVGFAAEALMDLSSYVQAFLASFGR